LGAHITPSSGTASQLVQNILFRSGWAYSIPSAVWSKVVKKGLQLKTPSIINEMTVSAPFRVRDRDVVDTVRDGPT